MLQLYLLDKNAAHSIIWSTGALVGINFHPQAVDPGRWLSDHHSLLCRVWPHLFTFWRCAVSPPLFGISKTSTLAKSSSSTPIFNQALFQICMSQQIYFIKGFQTYSFITSTNMIYHINKYISISLDQIFRVKLGSVLPLLDRSPPGCG